MELDHSLISVSCLGIHKAPPVNHKIRYYILILDITGMNRALPSPGAGFPLGDCTPPLGISWGTIIIVVNTKYTRTSSPSGTVNRAGLTTGGRGLWGGNLVEFSVC